MSQTDRHLQPNSIVPQLVYQSTQANADQLAQIVEVATTAPFANGLLEVDELLWGSFWHGDVIAPGYRLPAVELALLRAIRLDQNWPEKIGATEFLADLHQTIQHPQTGIWTMAVAGEPCVVFGGQGSGVGDLVTVVWYCATTGKLHAGYRTPIESLHMEYAIEQRKPEFTTNQPDDTPPPWLTQIELENPDIEENLFARLDTEILRIRRAGFQQKTTCFRPYSW